MISADENYNLNLRLMFGNRDIGYLRSPIGYPPPFPQTNFFLKRNFKITCLFGICICVIHDIYIYEKFQVLQNQSLIQIKKTLN